MPWHPPRHRVDRVLDVDAALLEDVGQLPCRVLRLGDRQPVSRNDDHPLRVGEQRAEVLGRGRTHAAPGGPRGAPRDLLHLAERAEQDVAQRAAHGVAHELGQQATRGTDQGPGHDEREVVQGEAGGGDRQARARVEQ